MNGLDREVIRVAFVAILIALVPSIPSCKTLHTSSSVAADDSGFESSLRNNFAGLCILIEDSANHGEETCKDLALTGPCDTNENSLSDAIKSLMNSPIPQTLAKTDEDKKSLAAAQEKDFREAFDHCVNVRKFDTIAKITAVAKDPQLQAQMAERNAKFWRGLVEGIVLYKEGKKSALYLHKNVPGALTRMFWAGICQAGFDYASSFVTDPGIDWNEDRCNETLQVDAHRGKACLKTLGSVCGGATGMVNFRNLPGFTTDNDLVQSLIDASSLGVSTACQMGGKLSIFACGALNQSALQISQFMTTGTNDWNECLTGPYARCFGMRLAGNWRNNSAIAQPRLETDRAGHQWYVRNCCACHKHSYQKVPWGYDTEFGAEWTLSVIQKGDFQTGNCGQQIGRTVIDAATPQFYSKYDYCEQVDVIGGSCALSVSTDGSTLKPQRLPTYCAKCRGATGEVFDKNGFQKMPDHVD